MEKINVAVSEFALPVPRRGSIDSNTGLGRNTPQIGIEIHQRIQAQRALESSVYEAEVGISREFAAEEYNFNLQGRMDGLYRGETPRIEEIKSTFNIHDLQRNLVAMGSDHPYVLQIKTYGYLYWLENNVQPALNLHLVSTRNGETLDHEVSLDLLDVETWFQLRLQELVEEVRLDEKRVQRRKKAAKAMAFPFAEPRSGQIELIQTIEDGMKDNQPMLLQAPTGLGKTIGVLYPTLKESLARGQKVIYVTPKNSQHAVAEDAIDRLQEAGVNLKSLTVTAKSKICLKNEAFCNPDYCEYAKDHYTKVAEHKIAEQLAKKRSLTQKTFTKIAEEFKVCPFEIQFDAARDADTVICDYNYVFAPRSALGSVASAGWAQTGKPNLVIDEAHNLPARAIDYYSPALSVFTLDKMREDTVKLRPRFRKKVLHLIDDCIDVVKKCRNKDQTKSHQIEPPFELFLEMDFELKAFLSTYLASDIEIQPKDVVMRLAFYWAEFTNALEYVQLGAGHSQFFTSFSLNPDTVKITCCDASEMLKDTYSNYEQVVGFSATLKPFEFYSRLAGMRSAKLKTAEFTSPFPKTNRKVLVIPQISSKFSDREKSYPRIAEAVEKITALKRGNYIVFCPSFEFMFRVMNEFKIHDGWQVLKQERSMKRNEIDHVLELLKDAHEARILFAVQGGVFSEGVDYPGHMVIGAFVVGPPLPHFDLEREKMREYYEEHYSSGFDYAYTYPAMAKAVQAAGRVIRSETDQGIIILMDNRFIQPSYAKSMPQDWFQDDPREMVSQSILKDIADFWSNLSP